MFSNPSSAEDPLGGGDIQSQFFSSFVGVSTLFAALGMVSQAFLGSSLKLIVMGSIVEMGRRLFQWLVVRFRFQYSITAQLDEGDPAYEWIVLFLTQEGVWKRSCDFVVSATNSRRKWSIKTWADPKVQGNAEYVPTYQQPQLFRWRGHWVEIKRSKEGEARFTPLGTFQPVSSIFLTIYTLDMSLLSAMVEDARTRYVEVNRPNVVIHLADSPHYSPSIVWTNVKHKVRRPLSSIILQDGVVDGLVRDAKEFLATEDWYVEAGIPHRRGYLLYGPPGTGKTSTIYALAGALNLEIYSLSLASSFVDDSFLQRAASSIPRHALFLIEDIDCAFANRDDEDKDAGRVTDNGAKRGMYDPPRAAVTLSGLLNVIDGVGSEEGKLFFATTNYIDRLDPALLRPGRIDRKVGYELSTAQQAHALFLRFFPEARFPEYASAPVKTAPQEDLKTDTLSNTSASEKPATADEPTDAVPTSDTKDSTATTADADADPPRKTIPLLAALFASQIPTGEFSTAELQGYLQSHKTTPAEAAAGAAEWVETIRGERTAREKREAERRRRLKERRESVEGREEHNGRVLVDKKDAGVSAKEGSGSEAESEFSSYADGAEEPRVA
ncbi:P-loop containing nucleoside triphosphate hydrolase protein [Mycena polygramma]|nr:P-loop containing nucleoside triphosphate hydrolase protein [Mycena polygramma]